MFEAEVPNFINVLQKVYQSGKDIKNNVANAKNSFNALINRLDIYSD